MKLQEIVPTIANKEQGIKSTSKAWLQRQAEQQIARVRDSRVGESIMVTVSHVDMIPD